MSDGRLTRRNLLKGTLCAAAGWGIAHQSAQPISARDYTQPVPGSDKLTVYKNGGRVLFRWNNHPLAMYRAEPTQKYPYFAPLSGPVTGVSLTTESALPYPHHRGLWLGCEPLNGGDYWSDGPLEKGQIRSEGPKVVDNLTTPTSAVITDRCQWIRPSAPSPFTDQRRITISVPNDHIRLLDIEFKLHAMEDITIKRAKHSFFALRCAPDISPMYGGVLMNSEGGAGAAGTYGKPARWCGYHGRRAFRPEVIEGIAIMNHPQNPWQPCPWFTRDYGHLSPSPFNFRKQPWQMSKGETLELKYRVVLHTGTPAEADLNGLYEKWIA